MQRDDWRRAFGETPESVTHRIAHTVRNLEEGKPVRKVSFKVVLIAAIITMLLVGTGFAVARQMGIFDFSDVFDSAWDSRPMDTITPGDIQDGSHTPTAETEHLRYQITEMAVKGHTVMLTIQVDVLEPDKYILIDDMMGDGMSRPQGSSGSDMTYGEMAKEAGKNLILFDNPWVRVGGESVVAGVLDDSRIADANTLFIARSFDTPMEGEVEIEVGFGSIILYDTRKEWVLDGSSQQILDDDGNVLEEIEGCEQIVMDTGEWNFATVRFTVTASE